MVAVVLFVAPGLAGSRAALAQAPPPSEQRPATADPFRKIVDFVLERDPVLRAQRDAVEAARRLGAIQLGGSSAIPAFAQGQLLKAELERAGQVAEAQERYTHLERTLVSEVLAHTYKLLSLVNGIRGQDQLRKMLQERIATIERQVQAGLAEPQLLWEALDRLAEVETEQANLKDQLQTLKRQVAFSYGGDDWPELLTLLDQLTTGS